MTEQDFGGVKVNVCTDGCKGLWLEWFALIKLDEKNEGLGDALQQALHYPRVNDETRGALNCPKCHIAMHRHLSKSDKEVSIDECYNCGGFFLDSGELNEIREHHMSEAEENAYADNMLTNLPSYQQAANKEAHEKSRANAIANYTRFMRVSYYATGK